MYNKCVELHTKNNKFFDEGYKIKKVKVFKSIYGDNEKKCPYDILTDEVRIFCSNLKSCLTNKKNRNIDHFDIRSKNKNRNTICIFIPMTAIKNESIYPTHLNKMKGMNQLSKLLKEHDMDKVTNDCRLIYIKDKNRYELIKK